MSRRFCGGALTGAPEGKMIGTISCNGKNCQERTEFPDLLLDSPYHRPSAYRSTPEELEAREAEERPTRMNLLLKPLPGGWLSLSYERYGERRTADFHSPRCARLFIQRIEKGEFD